MHSIDLSRRSLSGFGCMFEGGEPQGDLALFGVSEPSVDPYDLDWSFDGSHHELRAQIPEFEAVASPAPRWPDALVRQASLSGDSNSSAPSLPPSLCDSSSSSSDWSSTATSISTSTSNSMPFAEIQASWVRPRWPNGLSPAAIAYIEDGAGLSPIYTTDFPSVPKLPLHKSRIRAEKWEKWKPSIISLYGTMTLAELSRVMAGVGFEATWVPDMTYLDGDLTSYLVRLLTRKTQ